MMRAWIHAEQLAIEHVRNRRERVPVLGMNMGERPPDAPPGQSGANVRIVEHVKRIVIIDKLMAKSLAEHHPRDRDQKNADAEQRPARVFGAHCWQFKTASTFFQMESCFVRLAVLQQRLT